MEDNTKLIDSIKGLMTKYGFLKVDEPEYKSFNVGDNVYQAFELKVENEFFVINEESGEREVAVDGLYEVDKFKVDVKEGKITLVEEVKFAEVKMVDGTVLMIEGDEVAVGALVMVVTEEGEVPAPDGEYELEDGSKIVVVEGVVAEVKPKEEVEEPVEPVEAEQMNDIEGLYALLEGFVDNVGQRLEALESRFDTNDESFNSLKEDYEAFKKEPAGKPINTKKVELGSNKESDTLLRVRGLLKK